MYNCRGRLERLPRMRNVECSNPNRDIGKLKKQVETALRLNGQKRCECQWSSEMMFTVTVGAARLRTLTAQWP